jgi:hypothetical protein
MPGNEEKARAFTERTGIKSYKWDVSDFDACIAGIQQVESELGPVDVLVNNAGITRDGTMKRMTRQAWDEVIDVNLGGCFNMAKAVFEGMQSRKFGRIVNIGSINGQAGQYGQVNYAAAKSGIPRIHQGARPGRRPRRSHRQRHRSRLYRYGNGRRGPRGRPPEDRRPDSRRPPRRRPRNRPRGPLPVRRGGRLHHGIDVVHQWRPAHVLMPHPSIIASEAKQSSTGTWIAASLRSSQ